MIEFSISTALSMADKFKELGLFAQIELRPPETALDFLL